MSNRSLEILLGSKIRVKVLKSLFRNSDKNFTVGELADLTQVDLPTIKKEVSLLSEIGLIKVK